MSRKILTMGALALVFGGLSVTAADYWLRSNVRTVVTEVPVAPQIEFGTIVVAAEPVVYGTKLAFTNLRELPWPKDSLPEGAFATIKDLLADGDRAVLSALAANEPVLAAKISGPDGKATLSNRLRPGFRAVSIPVNSVSGVAGFVVPGDRVDVVLTREINGPEGPLGAIDARAPEPGIEEGFKIGDGQTVSSMIVVEGATVLTVDQIADDSQTDPVVVAVVTLELDANQARRVSSAENAGSLSLHLRKAGEEPDQPVAATPSMPKLPALPPVDPMPTSAYEAPAPSEPIASMVTVRHGDKVDTYSVRSEGGR